MNRRSFVYERNLRTEPEQEREFDFQQVATRLGISVRSVYRLKDEGEIKAYRRGPKKGYVVLESELERFIQERQQQEDVN